MVNQFTVDASTEVEKLEFSPLLISARVVDDSAVMAYLDLGIRLEILSTMPFQVVNVTFTLGFTTGRAEMFITLQLGDTMGGQQ